MSLRKIEQQDESLSQFALIVQNDFDPAGDVEDYDDEDNSDLEAELAAISKEDNIDRALKKPIGILLPVSDFHKVGVESMKDLVADDVEDEDLENNTDLLRELQEIITDSESIKDEGSNVTNTNPAGPELLPTTNSNSLDIIKKRIQMYEIALANAKSTEELPRLRRLNRGLKTLNDLLRQLKSGKIVNLDDIPPAVSIGTSGSEITRKLKECATGPPDSTVKNCPTSIIPGRTSNDNQGVPITTSLISTSGIGDEINEKEKPPSTGTAESICLVTKMRSLQKEYRAAALNSKRSGDNALALTYLKVANQIDVVVKMVENGEKVDLSDMPPHPEQFKEFMENMMMKNKTQEVEGEVTMMSSQSSSEVIGSEANQTDDTNILEALQQRLDKYRSVQETAEAEENKSKARRFGRIVKQYENAINAYKSGRPVDYEELPIPPGFDKLPAVTSGYDNNKTQTSNPQSALTNTAMPQHSKNQQNKSTNTQQKNLTSRTSGNQQRNNLAENQMKILLDRQKEFKLAALDAKRSGEVNQAKEYLKISRGFDALLNAASSGLPVDLSTLPLAPSQRDHLEDSFAIITAGECDPNDDLSDIGVRIEEQLSKQLIMCKNTRDHHKAMGDIAGMNRFENLALTVQKDLDLVRYSKQKNIPLPKFHYEQRSFNIVHCNTDLTDNELEITVARGISYNVPNPKEVDTYVKIDFPLLNGEVFKAKTSLVKDSDSPEYGQNFKVLIARGNRQFQRIFRRHAVKFEVFSRGGFLRSDIVIGVVNVKLQPLETKCEIHDSFDLFEGRRKVGGKLEIKLRVRNPVLTKQIEHINEKWLVIDSP